MAIMTKEYHNGYQQGYKDAKEEFKNTMHKYKKIQEIMNGLNGNFYGSYLKDRQTLEKIYKVIKDG